MSYCSSCGCKIEGNDLYCPSCGTKLSQTSGENQNKEKAEKSFDHVKSIANEINFDEIINTLKNSALNPVSGGIEFVAKSQKNTVISITIILAFLQGILGIWKIDQIFNMLQSIVSSFVQNLPNVTGLFGQGSSNILDTRDLETLADTINRFKLSITIPYPKIFIENCAIYLIVIFVLFGFMYLGIHIILKSKCTPFTLFKAVLISTLPILTCEIISILISYFSLSLGIGFIILGALISVTTLAIIVKESLQIERNLCVLIVSISSLLALVALFITSKNFIFSDLLDIVKQAMDKYQNSL